VLLRRLALRLLGIPRLCYRSHTASHAGPESTALCRMLFSEIEKAAAGAQKSMSQQPENPSTQYEVSPAALAGEPVIPVPIPAAGASAPIPQRIPRWLERIELLLRVMLRMYIGLAVCYAPWSPVFWDQNPIFLRYPALAALAANGAVRGLVSGLGLLNLWIALQDVLYRRKG